MREEADPVEALVHQLSRLPGIGERTALRLAFHLLQAPPALAEEIGSTLVEVRRSVVSCRVCGVLTRQDPCRICSDGKRDDRVLCVVETTSDVAAIERTGMFRGRYHVLQGSLRPLEGRGPESLNLGTLGARVAGGVEEVILATAPSVEGDATAMYIAELLKELPSRVTRLATGLPIGGDLEVADRATLGRALSKRDAFRW